MFDRFSDDCKRALNLARMASDRIGHDFLGSEHILLGLLDLGDGAWQEILQRASIEPAAVRLEVQKLLKPGHRGVMPAQLPFTPDAKRVLELAMAAAGKLGDRVIDTEHILLGLVDEKDGSAARALARAGLTPEAAWARVAETKVAAADPQPSTAESSSEGSGSFALAQTVALLRIAHDLLEANGELDTAQAVRGAIRRLDARR